MGSGTISLTGWHVWRRVINEMVPDPGRSPQPFTEIGSRRSVTTVEKNVPPGDEGASPVGHSYRLSAVVRDCQDSVDRRSRPARAGLRGSNSPGPWLPVRSVVRPSHRNAVRRPRCGWVETCDFSKSSANSSFPNPFRTIRFRIFGGLRTVSVRAEGGIGGFVEPFPDEFGNLPPEGGLRQGRPYE